MSNTQSMILIGRSHPLVRAFSPPINGIPVANGLVRYSAPPVGTVRVQHGDVTMSSSTRIIQDMEEEVSGLAGPLEVSCFHHHRRY